MLRLTVKVTVPIFLALVGQPVDVGEVRFANSGAPAAQASFLRGLAQLHNFEYDEAAEAFREAQQIDPGFAMAYWGEAMTKNHPIWMEQDREAARAVLSRLGPTAEARLARAPTEREKDYLRAIEVLYGEGDKRERDVAYAAAMAALHGRHPDDPDAAALHALAILGTAHDGRDFATYMRAAAIVEEVIDRFPNHPGAAHYLIHAYDDPVHAPLGLRAARRYAAIAPQAAHAQHMCSHIFVALGLWDDVVAANERAAGVMNARLARRGLPTRACGHYNFWLLYGYLQQGRHGDAKRLLAACRAEADRSPGARPGASAPDLLDPDNTAAGSFAQMRARYLIDTGDWTSEVAGWTAPLGDLVAARLTAEYATAYAAAKRGDETEARAAVGRFDAARRELDTWLHGHGQADRKYGARAEILQLQLEAMALGAEGRHIEAVNLLLQAAAAETRLPFEFGPPFIDKPSHELLGEVLLALDRPSDARAAFLAALARTPERTASLLGLARAAGRGGHAKQAEETYARLRRIWARADRLPDDVRIR